MASSGFVCGKIIDLHNRCMFSGIVEWSEGVITSVRQDDSVSEEIYVMPGLIDAHVHVESSMLIPSEFARIAVTHGTVATVSDPHEIGNVCGIEGVRYMIDDGARTPLKFAFGAPSCVPATTFETAGAEITADDIRELFRDERVRYLSEMMNWPGVLHRDPIVCDKIDVARACGRVIDGHAPGLRGEQAAAYACLGISTDHECVMLDEALDKIAAGMKILIREGSAARNFNALHPLLSMHPESVMLCCDDIHPDDLVVGHINSIVARAFENGHNIYDVLRAACVHPVEHYGLPVGLLRVGEPADFIVVDDLQRMNVVETWIDGARVACNGVASWPHMNATAINNFNVNTIAAKDIAYSGSSNNIRAIVAHDGELITSQEIVSIDDPNLCKIVVVNRYHQAPPAVAFIKNLGLVSGAFASTVAHDSHNIVAAGVNDLDIADAVNALIRCRGGICVSHNSNARVLELEVAGLMSLQPATVVAERYQFLDECVKELGSALRAPFMTLSFMALPVIPSLKVTDRGLFDADRFEFVDVHL